MFAAVNNTLQSKGTKPLQFCRLYYEIQTMNVCSLMCNRDMIAVAREPFTIAQNKHE